MKNIAKMKIGKQISESNLKQKLNPIKLQIWHANAKKFYLNLTYKHHLPS